MVRIGIIIITTEKISGRTVSSPAIISEVVVEVTTFNGTKNKVEEV